jgi:large subunit ribosomal protein L25
MKVFELKGTKREATGKKDAKKLRKQEMVPCVLYGAGENVHFFAHKNDFKDLVYTSDVFQIKADVEGKEYKAIMQDIQFHPVSDEILHIDFLVIEDNKPFTVSLPIKIVGTSPGVMAGGKMRQRRRYLKVSGLLNDMPDSIEIDISQLQVGGGIKVGDMKSDKLAFVDPHQSQILGVISGRAAAAAMEVAEAGDEEGEEGAEGEEAAEGGESDEPKEE